MKPQLLKLGDIATSKSVEYWGPQENAIVWKRQEAQEQEREGEREALELTDIAGGLFDQRCVRPQQQQQQPGKN